MKCCCALLVCLLGLALVGAAPSLLPGDPNYSPEHAHEHHGEHAHEHHGEHEHGHHGEHAQGPSLAQGIPDFPSPEYASAAPLQPAPVGAPSLAQGIPDFPSSYPQADANPAPLPVSGGAAPLPVTSGPVQQPGRPSNPFLSGAVVPPASSTFQVQVQPVPARAQRPTPEPIIELNTNPLGGPAGPKGPVQASCPGPASALPCVPEQQCDPYTGFLKSDEVKLPYPITKDTPTVAIGQCKLGGSAIGVCCKKFPRPAPTTTTTALPLGVDYGQGLEHLKRPATEKPPNPFLPNYKPTY